MVDCESKHLTYDGRYLACTHCGWRKELGLDESVGGLMDEVGYLHINDWPTAKLGQYRIVERLMKESFRDVA